MHPETDYTLVQKLMDKIDKQDEAIAQMSKEIVELNRILEEEYDHRPDC